ncbi:MAG: methyltransferase domain-containing protein [Candidatus Falkowbacteria bacterium]
MQYFFILGNNLTLSFAELVSVLNLKQEQVLFLSEKAMIADVREELDVQRMIRRLGGTIKIGVINGQSSIINLQLSIFNEQIFNEANINGKFNFGISYYGPSFAKATEGKFNEKSLAMELKKALKEKGVNSRWVTSREEQLSSVVVEQNKLIGDKGIEIVIINDRKTNYIGKTLAVQPFKELSKRDYGRPGRDDRSGMLPPKLAQIALTLTLSQRERGQSSPREFVLLDPFCGSGTILTEAMLMNALTPNPLFSKIIGCDKSEKAVSNTRENFQFTISNFHSIFNKKISNDQLKLFQCDVKNLSNKIKPNSIDAVVTEPYLGPSNIRRDRNSIEKVVKELEQLYHEAILEFEKALKSKGRVVMIWPVFRVDNGDIMLNTKNILKHSSFEIINPLKDFDYKVLKLTNRNTIIYGREGQKVWREIVILEK